MEQLTLTKKEMLSYLRKVKYVYGNVRMNENCSTYYNLVKSDVIAQTKKDYDEATFNVRIEGNVIKVMFID